MVITPPRAVRAGTEPLTHASPREQAGDSTLTSLLYFAVSFVFILKLQLMVLPLLLVMMARPISSEMNDELCPIFPFYRFFQSIIPFTVSSLFIVHALLCYALQGRQWDVLQAAVDRLVCTSLAPQQFDRNTH